MLKKKVFKKRLISFMMSVMMALSVVTPGLAAEPASGSSIVSDSAIAASGSSILPGFESSEAATEYHEPNSEDTSTDVEVEIGASYTVTVPKRITLGNGMATYKVVVQGDVGGLYRVQVRPDRNFVMKESGGRTDVLATVNQDYLLFASEQMAFQNNGNVLYGIESGAESNGTVSMLKKAGIWTGRFNFYIALVSASDEESAKLMYRPIITVEGVETGEAEVYGINPDYADADSFTVDEKYDGMYVTKIGNNVFKGNTNIKKIYINMSSGEIEAGAFEGCTNLEEVVFGYDTMKPGILSGIMNFFSFLKPVKVHAAEKRSLKIDENAFKDCTSLKKVVLENVTSVGDNAFDNCNNLTDVEFGSKIESVGASVVSKDSLYYKDLEANSNDGIIRDDGIVFGVVEGVSGNLTLSDEDRIVADSACEGSKVTALDVSENTKVLGRMSFAGSDVLDVDVNEGKTNVSSSAFYGTPYELEKAYDEAYEAIKAGNNISVNDDNFMSFTGDFEREEREDGVYERSLKAVDKGARVGFINSGLVALMTGMAKNDFKKLTADDITVNGDTISFNLKFGSSTKARPLSVKYISADEGYTKWVCIERFNDDLPENEAGEGENNSESGSGIGSGATAPVSEEKEPEPIVLTESQVLSAVNSLIYTRWISDISYPDQSSAHTYVESIFNALKEDQKISVEISDLSYIKAIAGTEDRYLGYDGHYQYGITKVTYTDPYGEVHVYDASESNSFFDTKGTVVLTAKRYVEGSDMDLLISTMNEIFSNSYAIGRYEETEADKNGLWKFRQRTNGDLVDEIYAAIKRKVTFSKDYISLYVTKDYIKNSSNGYASKPEGTDGYIYTNIELRSDRTGETLSRGNLYTKIYALRHTPSLIKNILNSYDNSIINVITEIDKADANSVNDVRALLKDYYDDGLIIYNNNEIWNKDPDCKDPYYEDVMLYTSGYPSNFKAATNSVDGSFTYTINIKNARGYSLSYKVKATIKAPGICEECNGTGASGTPTYEWKVISQTSGSGQVAATLSLWSYLDAIKNNPSDYKVDVIIKDELVNRGSNSAKTFKGAVISAETCSYYNGSWATNGTYPSLYSPIAGTIDTSNMYQATNIHTLSNSSYNRLESSFTAGNGRSYKNKYHTIINYHGEITFSPYNGSSRVWLPAAIAVKLGQNYYSSSSAYAMGTYGEIKLLKRTLITQPCPHCHGTGINP